uniref:Conserved secreted protein n=1 Tax=Panagrellus redivivus TaxID=6233 RepID=A0A7E4VWW8_PANRE
MKILPLICLLSLLISAQCAPLPFVDPDQVVDDALDSTKETSDYLGQKLIASNEKLTKALDKYYNIVTKYLVMIYDETKDLFEDLKMMKIIMMVLLIGIVISCIVFPIVFMLTMILVSCVYCQKSGLEIAQAEIVMADRKRQKLALFRQRQMQKRAQLLVVGSSESVDNVEGVKDSGGKEEGSLRVVEEGSETNIEKTAITDLVAQIPKTPIPSSDQGSSSAVTSTVRTEEPSPAITSKQSSTNVVKSDSVDVKTVNSGTNVAKTGLEEVKKGVSLSNINNN